MEQSCRGNSSILKVNLKNFIFIKRTTTKGDEIHGDTRTKNTGCRTR